MSKLINNEASRKASFGILESLKEAEKVEVKKTVMYEGACASCKSCEEPEGSNVPVPKEKKEPLEEAEEQEEITSDDDTSVKEEVDPRPNHTKINNYLDNYGIDISKETLDSLLRWLPDNEIGEFIDSELNGLEGEFAPEFESAEEKMVEGLEVLESANGAFLLKESAGYIVGKNYNKETGIIEEAECYKTEKVARRVFNKISK